MAVAEPILVAGAWRPAVVSHTYRAIDPATGAPLEAEWPVSGWADVEAALAAATVAAGELARLPGAAIAAFLERYAARIEARAEEFVAVAHAETGLAVKPRLADVEMPRTLDQLRQAAASAREGTWRMAMIDRAKNIRAAARGLGPVVVFPPANFPFAYGALTGGDFAAAIAAGNPVIGKAHEGHPGVSRLAAGEALAALEETGLPSATVQLLHGLEPADGLRLVADARVGATGFTGSQAAGEALFRAASAAGRVIWVEMGSVNPVVLLPAALAERAATIADDLTASVTGSAGQFCTKPGILVAVEGEDLVRFRTELAAAVAAAAPASMLTAEILREYDAHRETLLGVAGVRVLARADAAADAIRSQAAAVVAETDAATFLAQPQCSEEVFGPCSLLVAVRDLTELRAVARRLDGQLTATIHGTDADLDEGADLFELLAGRAGRLIVNGYPTGVEVCHAMQHGGPAPATSDSRFTSVGTAALERFIRPVCLQDMPDRLLPPALQDANPLGLERIVEGVRGRH